MPNIIYRPLLLGAFLTIGVPVALADDATITKALQLVELSIQCPTPAVSYKEVEWEPPVSKLITKQFVGDDDMLRVTGKSQTTFDATDYDNNGPQQFTTVSNRFRYDVPFSSLGSAVANDNTVALTCSGGDECISHNQFFHCSDCSGNDEQKDVSNRLARFELTMCDAATAQRLAVGLKLLIENRKQAGSD